MLTFLRGPFLKSDAPLGARLIGACGPDDTAPKPEVRVPAALTACLQRSKLMN
jgi:hypothetical protein